MDSGTSAWIIYESYLNKKIIMRKISTNQWTLMAGYFSTSREAEISLKISELYVMANISAPFQLTAKKVIIMLFLV